MQEALGLIPSISKQENECDLGHLMEVREALLLLLVLLTLGVPLHECLRQWDITHLSMAVA